MYESYVYTIKLCFYHMSVINYIIYVYRFNMFMAGSI